MSSVRMCDTCGGIFSELDENWSTGTMETSSTDPNTGKRITRTLQRDQCGSCNVALTRPRMIPQVPIPENPGLPAVTADDRK